MCDGSGLKQAFNAWRLWREEHPQEPGLPGLDMSDEKLFFIFYGQVGQTRYNEPVFAACYS